MRRRSNHDFFELVPVGRRTTTTDVLEQRFVAQDEPRNQVKRRGAPHISAHTGERVRVMTTKGHDVNEIQSLALVGRLVWGTSVPRGQARVVVAVHIPVCHFVGHGPRLRVWD